jgi:hypothetical protein
MVDLSTLDDARRDPSRFAELLVGAPLWPHQAEVAMSAARYRLICAGRQVGKSRLLAVLALWQAFSRAGCHIVGDDPRWLLAVCRSCNDNAGEPANRSMWPGFARHSSVQPCVRCNASSVR